MPGFSEMESEIAAIIKQSLPSQVGDILSGRLKEAKNLEEQIERLNDHMSDKERELSKLRMIQTTQRDLEKRKNELDQREKKLNDQERAAEIEKLKFQLEEVGKRESLSTSLAMSLTRNVEYRRSFFGDVPVGVGHSREGQYGNTEYPQSVTATVNQTTTEASE